ncbi:hypothetical protein NKG94_32245 [Micromonospora sp. M12]
MATNWPGRPAPKVRLLPRRLQVAELARIIDRSAPGIPVGVNESALAPVYLDLVNEPHLTVFGDAECGKTNLLRLIARGITERYTPAQARLVIADYRRGLLGAVEGDHLLDYAPRTRRSRRGSGRSAARCPSAARPGRDHCPAPRSQLVEGPGPVHPGGRLRPGGLRWQQPAQWPSGAPPQARDIGLHLIVTRRVGGVSRALYEPVLQRLRELDSPGLLMSGNREEGAVSAHCGRARNRPAGALWSAAATASS